MKLTVHVEGKTTAEIGKELSNIAAAIGGASVTAKTGKKKKEEEETFGEDDDADALDASDDSDDADADEDSDADSDDDSDSDDAPTHEALVAAFAKYAKKTSNPKAILKLNKLGYKRLTDVKEKDRAKVIAAVSKA